MTVIGWEFWGLKFSWLIIALVSVVLFVYTWLKAHQSTNLIHVDRMAGDEGEE